MQTDRIVVAPLFEHTEGCATCGKEILGMDFQKIHRRPLMQHLRVMRVPPADAHTSGRDRHYFFIALASSAVMPFMSLQVPLATYFHSALSMSTLDWPAQEWAPVEQ